ncbi:MAG: TIM barrel protein [Spirochaetes bacterium]|nr:TIM barrel protein [Spirochaetota bacterium]
MKTSISTFVYFKYPLTEAIKRISCYGYEGVELWGGRPHAYCDDMTKDRISEVARVIEDHELCISNFIPAQFRYPTNLAAPDQGIREKSISYIKKNIDVAVEVGAPTVSLCPGFSMYGQSLAEAWDCMMMSFGELLEYSKGMRIELILEPGHRDETDLVVTIDDALKVSASFGNRIGILPDTGHLFINKEPISDVVEKVAGNTHHFHIDDNYGSTDDHLVPGDGGIYFDIFLNNLEKSKYDGFLAVELGYRYCNDPDSAAKRSLEYLKTRVTPV